MSVSSGAFCMTSPTFMPRFASRSGSNFDFAESSFANVAQHIKEKWLNPCAQKANYFAKNSSKYDWEQLASPLDIFNADSKGLAEVLSESLMGVATVAHRSQFHSLLDALADADVPNSKRMSARLVSLLEMAIEDEPNNCAPISLDSLHTFVEFFVGAKPKSYPEIALTPDGNLFSAWIDRKASSSLQIVFQDGYTRMLWTTVGNSKNHKKERVTARKPVAALIEMLTRLGALPN